MKRIWLTILVFSALGFAQGNQQPVNQQQPQPIVRGGTKISNVPTPNDIYCSGFITTENIPESHYVAGGRYSPDQAYHAGTSDRLFIHGSGLKEGDRLQIVRKVKDPNHYESYRGEKAAINALGQLYFERGFVRVVDVQKNIAIAIPELSCADMVPGDLAIPLVEREKPVFRNVKLDPFSPPNGKTTGRIVLANEFDTVLGSTQKVYLNIGADKGIKVGDYLRATRTYEYTYSDAEAGLAAKAVNVEETQKNPPKITKGLVSEFPRQTLADMIVLTVHPKSSTAMIMTALQDVHVGDMVELMDVSGAPEVSGISTPTPAGAPAMTGAASSPPSITCSSSPATVHVGESVTISCDANSPDNRPLRIQFSSSGGKLSASGNRATLDTTQAGSGPIQVRAVATDDRDLSASTIATVNVQP
jgi:hypothetical protein